MKEFLIIFFTQIVFGHFLQCITCVIWLSVFDKNRLNKKLFWILSLSLTVSTYLVRLLPIRFGIHTLLSIIFVVLISIWMLQISVNKSVFIGLGATLLITISEILSYLIFVLIIGEENFKIINGVESLYRYVAGDVGALIFFTFVVSFYWYKKKRKRDKI
ncbi:MAG: hypothetical protein A2Y17_02530 [Clostridiales bacterium GWF2_38_85]|nr:MAG: hypothetical protein A2Y17_02530 [Clostridiales bacterium GWF2_38_85]HBL85074.1 hypothetical protein [Clostridiales bacterium]